MPDATEGRRRQTCRRILDAARAIAVADGPDALSMRTLADRVGLSAPALYQYFSGRDAIVDEVADDVVAELVAAIDVPTADGPGRVAEMASAYVTYAEAHVNDMLLVFCRGPAMAARAADAPAPAARVRAAFIEATETAGRPGRGDAVWSLAHGRATLGITDMGVESFDLGAAVRRLLE